MAAEHDQPKHASPAGAGPAYTASELRELLAVVCQTDVSELVLEAGGVRLALKRDPALAAREPVSLASSESLLVSSDGSQANGAREELLITAPMVGTFYRAPSPHERPFVAEGDWVESGQTVGIIEAMKMMNEVLAEHPGRVVQILTENAHPVEYGQPLVLLDPAAAPS